MPMQWTNIQVPLGGGLDTKSDPRLAQSPNALTLKNANFDETGGIQTRLPFTSQASVTNARKLAAYGNELVCFTKDEIYTWSDAAAGFVSRGTYLAPKITEKSVFIRTAEQTCCDRVEKSGVIVYAWLENSAAATAVYVGAIDKATGTVLVAPTSLGANTERPRLVALSGQSQVLLFAKTASSTLSVKALDVSSAANLATSIAASWTSVITGATGYGAYYDVVPLDASTAIAVYRRGTTTSYGYATVALSGAVCTVSASTKARTCDGPIAVAVTADGTKVAVIRGNGTTIEGDILTSALVDSSVGVSIATSAISSSGQIAAAFRSTADSGQYRCYVYWTADPGNWEQSTSYASNLKYIDTAGSTGVSGVSPYQMVIASRAFDYDGHVYCWFAFVQQSTLSNGITAQPQNTFFLYRDDGTLVAKAAPDICGGFSGGDTSAAAVYSWLPNVQNVGTNKYAFSGTERRRVPIGGGQKNYADRGPRDIMVEFDSNEARRTVQLGKTLYITGGQIMQYDGEGAVELGYHIYPYHLNAIALGSGGSLSAGSYSYKAIFRWDNAKGETDRSTTLAEESITAVSSDAGRITGRPVYATLKGHSSRAYPAFEIWRTIVNPDDGADFYLVTNPNPTSTAGANCYVYVDPTANFTTPTNLDDHFSDATLENKETFRENGAVLENISPPPATIIAASDTRLFLAGISNDPLLIWYSQQRDEGNVAAFHESLSVVMPPAGGDITGIAVLNGSPVVFKKTGIYMLPGDGYDNTGGGQNYGTPLLISSDVGATSADLIATTPQGLIFFSQKGWYLLDRSLSLQYIGGPVEDYNTDTFNSVVVLETKHQIRCMSSSRILTFDYLVGAWSEGEESSVAHSCLWQGDSSATYNAHWYVTSSAVYREKATHGTSVTTSLTYKSPWFKVGDLTLGAMRVKQIGILGEYRSAHDLKIELFKDYDDSSAFQTTTWTVSPTTVGGPEIARVSPSIQKVTALSIRITAKAVGLSSAPTGEALKLSGLTFRVGVKQGIHPQLPAAQKT